VSDLYRTAIDHLLVAIRELDAARKAIPDESDRVLVLRLADAAQWAVVALDALRERCDEGKSEAEIEATCSTCCGPLYLGTCVRCWARREMGVRP
jgi:hypothetical protein